MSTQPARERPPGKTQATADPPGEVPTDLRDAGWELKEHVNGAGEFQLHNKRLKLLTSPYATPALAFEAARTQQRKGKTAEKKGEAGGGKVTVSRSFRQPLKTRLTGDELLARLGDWRTKRAKKEEIEAEARQVADGYKGQAGKLDAEVKAIEKALVTQAEEREVECQERMDYEAKRVYVVRLDTGEEVEGQARPMTQKELQPTLLKL